MCVCVGYTYIAGLRRAVRKHLLKVVDVTLSISTMRFWLSSLAVKSTSWAKLKSSGAADATA